MQPFDYTTLKAVCYSLQENYIPSRLEQVYQCDRTSISLCLRNIEKKSWLTISWHPQAARICVGNPPPRGKDTFTFSDQLRHLINGYALIGIEIVSDWERVIDFQFAQRPNESPLNHLYVEIMGKYSNVILTNADNQIITVAKQVTADKSTLRTVETSQIYQLPPPLTGNIPKLEESQETWQEKVSLIPGRIDKQLIKSYRGISPNIAKDLLHKSNIDLSKTNQELTQNEWKELYQNWQTWLTSIEKNQFYSHLTSEGYTVLGEPKQAENINFVINEYYNQKNISRKFYST